MNRYFWAFLFFLCISNFGISQQTVGLFFNDSASFNGYTLFAPSSSQNTYLINNCGEVIQIWMSDYRPGASAYLLENGNLLRTARINSSFNGGGTGGRLELFNWEGDLLWAHNYSNDIVHQHHDIQPLPNGNILILAWEKHTPEEAIAAGRNPTIIPTNGIWAEQVVEVEMVGTDAINIVWEWHLWDHLIQDFDSTKLNFGIIADHPGRMDLNYANGGIGQGGNSDWLHYNSIDYKPDLDQILLSSRSMNEIYIIDHSTTSEEAAGSTGGNSGKGGAFLYRWGNPIVYDRGQTSDQKFFGQHNANWIPAGYPNAGKIMVFNNGQGRPGGSHSTVDVLLPPINPNGTYNLNNDEAFAPVALDWEYIAEPPNAFYANRISGAQRLPNGNTLICEGTEGHFFEVDHEGTIVWDYVTPINGNNPVSQGNTPGQNDVFRATRYGTDYAAFSGRALTPGEPIEINPIDIGCQIWEEVTSTFHPNDHLAFTVLGNPFKEKLKVENIQSKSVWVEILSLSGVTLLLEETTSQYFETNTSQWPNGLYLLRIYDAALNLYHTQKIIKQ